MTSKNQVKVVLLGAEFGGKTSLVERFINHRFVELSSDTYQATVGAAFASRKIVVEPRGKAVHLAIWDTAGSERFAPMARMYFRNAKVAIVCFDLTNIASFERAKHWIKELQSFEEDCAIYLCGTKCDLVHGLDRINFVSMADVQRLKEQVGAKYFETSSKTGQGVTKLFLDIARDFRFHEFQTDDTTSQMLEDDEKKKFKCNPCS